MTDCKTLSHNEVIRLATWNAGDYARVFGLRGFCEAGARDYDAALARARQNGHDIAATMHSGTALVDDGGKHYAREEATAATATILTEGETVEIEGVRYMVGANHGNEKGPRNSDPIRFEPVKIEAPAVWNGETARLRVGGTYGS